MKLDEKVESGGYLETLAVHADVPVGQVIDKANEAGHNGVEPVSRHLCLNEEQQRLGERHDPLVHHVDRKTGDIFVVLKLHALLLNTSPSPDYFVIIMIKFKYDCVPFY